MSSDSWNPEQYEKFKKERELPFYDLMTFIQPSNFAQAMDLGCGTGEMTCLFHDKFKVAHTTGLDNSENMLKKAAVYSTDNLQFQNGDIATFSSVETYDVIISNAAIQWVPNHDQVFQNIYKSLRPNGQMCVQMPANHDYPTHTVAGEFDSELHTSSMKTPSEYAKLLFQLGFTEQKVEMKVYGHVTESRDAVVEWVKGTLLTSFKNRMSDDEYAQFLIDYKKRLFGILPDERPFFYPFKRIFLWGRK